MEEKAALARFEGLSKLFKTKAGKLQKVSSIVFIDSKEHLAAIVEVNMQVDNNGRKSIPVRLAGYFLTIKSNYDFYPFC